MKKSVIGSFLALSLVLLFAGSAIAVDINLSVAASLREVVTELSDSFAKSHAGVTFQNNFGASGALAKQIESGAPADLFFSANLEWMDYLKERKLLDEKSISTFAYNVLVFVGKPGSKVTRLQDVVKLEKIAIGSPKSVPAASTPWRHSRRRASTNSSRISWSWQGMFVNASSTPTGARLMAPSSTRPMPRRWPRT